MHASLLDFEKIVALDCEVIGGDHRREYIYQAIEEKRCLVVKKVDKVVAYLIFNTQFFECSFVSLLIVSPNERRKGYASILLSYFASMSPTEKIFSSTNESNTIMQKVFLANGYEKSGIVQNLDEGDSELLYFKRVKKDDY